ncbi:ABC transporter substrate-binding protein [Actinacidiphila oryziradicis]|uniref:ABC transporter substrate-binding protein n=1 Tax=Actinacidiphila oryziradicis TaxID=2571141 RepID=UPI0023F2341E|nr:ABC transporter substrate-binding protein [Actinacidiphila oryziradicis]MCW2874825.1 transporter substrate-binding protein [Actinacidiphila oryziradicis]
MLDRRDFLKTSGAGMLGMATLAVGGSSLLAACSSSGKSGSSSSSSGSTGGKSTPTSSAKLQLSWVYDAEFAGYYIADTLGYYPNNHLKMSMSPGGPNVTPEQVVVSGRAMFGLDGADYITSARNKGGSLVIIGAQFQKNPLGVLSLKKANITKPGDLVGKKLGVPSGQYDQIKSFLKINSVNPSDVTFVSYGTDPTPLANGSIDAAIAFTTTDPFLLQEKGYDTATFTLADFGYNIYNDCVFVTEDTLKNHRSELVDFMRASILGWQYNIANPSYVLPLITNKYGKPLGLSTNSQKFQNAAQIPLMQSAATKANGLFWMSDADIAVNLETITKAGIKADKAIFDTSILAEVYHGANHI